MNTHKEMLWSVLKVIDNKKKNMSFYDSQGIPTT